jgi:hypothetical protein
MEERVCIPIRDDGETLAYIWLLDPEHDLGEEHLREASATALCIAEVLANEPDLGAAESALILKLDSGHARDREHAIAELRTRGLLLDHDALVCLFAPTAPEADVVALAGSISRRLSRHNALAGSAPEGAVLLASLADPAFASIGVEHVAEWLHSVVGGKAAIGQSGVVDDGEGFGEGFRQARIALRVAQTRPPGATHAGWAELGADRLLAQLPVSAAKDVPRDLARLFREEPTLATTLATFLEAGGAIKATAAQLNLHRSGLYYRLRRIEELTGLHLDQGDDRLLAHVAVRLAKRH